jgi:hypothetical protein
VIAAPRLSLEFTSFATRRPGVRIPSRPPDFKRLTAFVRLGASRVSPAYRGIADCEQIRAEREEIGWLKILHFGHWGKGKALLAIAVGRGYCFLSVDFKNLLDLGRDAIQQPKVTAGDADDHLDRSGPPVFREPEPVISVRCRLAGQLDNGMLPGELSVQPQSESRQEMSPERHDRSRSGRSWHP